MTRRGWHPFDIVTRVFAERLQGCAPSDQLLDIVRSQNIDWERVVGHASGQFVLPAFAAALRDLDLAASLEPELRRFLAAVHEASVERNEDLRDQLAEVVRNLNRIGIEPVLLKGANRLVGGLYPDPGWRLMVDLDVLVAEGEFMDAVRALQKAGYDSVRAIDPARKDVKLCRDGHSSVEVHKELFWTTRKQQLLRGADVIAGSQPAILDGARVRLPSIEHQITHLVGHSQLGHFNYLYGRIALRDRLEAAALLHRTPGTIDWNAVHARFAAAGYHRPLRAFLLSLRDGGLCAPPIESRVDTLAALQARRIAVLARSPTMTRISLFIGWHIVLFKLHAIERDARWPDMRRSLTRMLRDRQERRRIARILVREGPHPW
jgi:hypothetical protein